jgi:hypothetical protein
MKDCLHTKWLRWGMAAAAVVLLSAPAWAQPKGPGQGTATVTILNKQAKAAPPMVTRKELYLRVDGRPAAITRWQPASGPLQIVLLIDNGARTSLGQQMNDIRSFVRELPSGAALGIAYMQNGQAQFTGPLTADKERALQELQLPAGTPGSSASPYFCLSDLAKHWPSHEQGARREVIMVTNGVDNYEPRYDPNDPYVLSAIRDSLQAGLVVNSIYWTNSGWFGHTAYAANTGQNLLIQVAQATGGKLYWQGFGNPVTFQPYFKDLLKRFGAQYELRFAAPMLERKPYVANLNLKVHVPDAKVDAPNRVWLTSAAEE